MLILNTLYALNISNKLILNRMKYMLLQFFISLNKLEKLRCFLLLLSTNTKIKIYINLLIILNFMCKFVTYCDGGVLNKVGRSSVALGTL